MGESLLDRIGKRLAKLHNEFDSERMLTDPKALVYLRSMDVPGLHQYLVDATAATRIAALNRLDDVALEQWFEDISALHKERQATSDSQS